MPALFSSLAASGGAWAIAGSFGVHGALMLVGLLAHGVAAAPSPAAMERLIDVDLVAPPPTAAPIPPPVTPEPQPAVAPVHPPPTPAVHEVAPRATATTDAPPAPVAQEAAPALTAEEGMPHFTIAIGGGSAPTYGAVSATGTAHVEVVDAPLPEQGVSARAHLAHGRTPPYPSGARAEGVEGDVVLELVLSTSGTVDSARVLKGAGHGLDEAAVAGVRNYRFSPATKDGRPVRVRMQYTMQFRLQ